MLGGTVKRMRLWGIFLLIGASLVVLLILFLSPLLRVSSMRVSRQDARLDIEEIQKLLLPFFGKHLFSLSPQTVERVILTAYPDVTSVHVAKRMPGALHVTLYTDPIVALVSLGTPEGTERSFTPLSGSGTYHYLTSQGVFLEYDTPLHVQQEGGEYTQLKVVDWAVKPVHRQKLLPSEMVRDMQHVQRLLLQSFGQRVNSITTYIRAREYHVTTERLTLWFDAGNPIVQQLDRYREFLHALPGESAEKYIDLRLHDRVVYR